MKTPLILLYLVLGTLIVSCNSETTKKLVANTSRNTKKKNSASKDSAATESYDDMLLLKTFTCNGYAFKFRYLKYGDTTGKGNPALLQIFKDQMPVFTDSIWGEGPLYVDTLGYHNVSGRKLFFTLSYGIEACDYAQTSRFYFISPEGKIAYLHRYYSICGGDGYSCTSFDKYFPEDSSGTADVLRIVEGMHYNENDHPNISDTTNITFEGDKFIISKLTHKLEKALE